MKTPLALLAITLLLAGCSTTSNQIDNPNLESQQSNSPVQSKEKLFNSVKEIEVKMANVKDITDCDQFTDKNMKQDCIVNIAFSESELGNQSLCKSIDDLDLKSECQQLSKDQDR